MAYKILSIHKNLYEFMKCKNKEKSHDKFND